MGGREVRKGIDHGEIFDHHYVEYKYASGAVSKKNAMIFRY